MSKKRREPVVVERSYEPDAEAGLRAIEFLFTEKAAERSGGEDPMKGLGDDRAKRSLPR